MTKAKSKTGARLRLAILPIVVATALLVAWRLGYYDLDRRDHLLDAIQRARGITWATPLYVLAYVGVVLLGLPTTIFSVVGGAVFGAWPGFVLAWSGAMLGTLAAHVLARSVAKGPVKRLFGNHRLLRKLRERGDVWALIRLRVLPVAPFGVLDYVAGIAGVSLKALLIATAISMLPSTIAYTYVGQQVVAGLTHGGDGGRRALWIAGIVTVAMAMLPIAPWVARRLSDAEKAE